MESYEKIISINLSLLYTFLALTLFWKEMKMLRNNSIFFFGFGCPNIYFLRKRSEKYVELKNLSNKSKKTHLQPYYLTKL